MNTVDLSTYNNSDFHTGGSFIKRILWYFANIVFLLNPWFPYSGLKVRILRLFGAKVGRNVVIKPSVNVKYPWNLIIGDNTWIGENVWIDNLVTTIIGNNCCISQGAMLLCGNHDYTSTDFSLIVKPIVIEDGCWLCAKSVVCPGVTMHTHSILSVLSVATSDTDAYTIYSGNPATKRRERNLK